MKLSEVKELFLTESMMMGVFGGFLGFMAGYGLGKIVSIVLSSISIFRGGGALDVAFLPAAFIIAIVLLSLMVGFVTELYPAKRATKISALDAPRYE